MDTFHPLFWILILLSIVLGLYLIRFIYNSVKHKFLLSEPMSVATEKQTQTPITQKKQVVLMTTTILLVLLLGYLCYMFFLSSKNNQRSTSAPFQQSQSSSNPSGASQNLNKFPTIPLTLK